jgi:BirA family biotin operon repressor/biotin-[acetyl-CoA-carboxylase] ligase
MGPDLPAARHIALQGTDSTNAEALRRARGGEAGPLWITAETQTSGRGRGGNAWVSEPGNLYASLLLIEPSPPRFAPQLALSRRWRCTMPSRSVRRTLGRSCG